MPLLPAAVAEMDGVDAQEAGLAAGLWPAADADAHRSGPALAEVVDVAVGDGGEAGERSSL